jgi:hypothetical protein
MTHVDALISHMGYFYIHLEVSLSILSTPLDDVLASMSKVRLLRLFTSATDPLSGREAGRRAGMAKRTADLALRELLALGLLRREDTPAQALYQLNREHPLVTTALIPLFAAEQQWTDTLFQALRDLISGVANEVGAEVVWAGIYGSVARGDEDSKSDFDLAIITRTSPQADALHTAISEKAPHFTVRFGRQLSPLVQPLAQLRRLATAKDPLMQALTKDARRLLGTRDIAEVLRG